MCWKKIKLSISSKRTLVIAKDHEEAKNLAEGEAITKHKPPVKRFRQFLPNAPKRQPCPKCHSWVKRTEKWPTRAVFYCPGCKLTFMESLR